MNVINDIVIPFGDKFLILSPEQFQEALKKRSRINSPIPIY